tara:strand:+ start:603 stop:809 length:207 start_codon:yes stop_codon:yes gene_type:complete
VLATILWIGTVDVIEGEIAMVQVTGSDLEVRDMEMSTLMFPCEIEEGDFFYFAYSEGVTEIRCGEPPQ